MQKASTEIFELCTEFLQTFATQYTEIIPHYMFPLSWCIRSFVKKRHSFLYTFRFNAAIGYGPGDRDFTFSTTHRRKRFLFSRKLQDRHCGLPSILFHSYERGFPRGDAISA